MDITTYKDALDKAKKDLAVRLETLAIAQEQAAEAERDVVELRQTIAALAKLCGEPEFVEEDALGITDAVRLAFRTDEPSMDGLGSGLSAHDIRAKLQSMGYAGRWANVLASIHTVINRLREKGEIEVAGNINGRETYKWKDTTRKVPEYLRKALRVNQMEQPSSEHPMRAAFGRPRKTLGQKIGDGLFGDGKKK